MFMTNRELTEAIDLGIIDMSAVHQSIMMNRKQQVLKMHKYKISLGSDGRYQTMFVDTATGKRKNIKGRSEDEILTKLVDLYYQTSYIDKLTFRDVYEQWLEHKKLTTSSVNTLVRHKQHYQKYFAQSKLDAKKFKNIDSIFLTEECCQIIKNYNLSNKEWQNVKTILNGMYELAVAKKYIQNNIMQDVKITVKFRQVVKKSSRTEVFNNKEIEELNAYLDAMISDTQDSSFYAVRINMMCGLRVGELVALKWSDIEGMKLHVIREEVRNQETNTYSVEEHTKTHEDRYVTLVPQALKLFEELEHQGEYVFMRNNERLTSRQVQYVLEKYAERNDKTVKRSHKMRKTYASRLANANVSLDCIRENMGHSNLQTTLSYVYNTATDEETYNLMSKALA